MVAENAEALAVDPDQGGDSGQNHHARAVVIEINLEREVQLHDPLGLEESRQRRHHRAADCRPKRRTHRLVQSVARCLIELAIRSGLREVEHQVGHWQGRTGLGGRRREVERRRNHPLAGQLADGDTGGLERATLECHVDVDQRRPWLRMQGELGDFQIELTGQTGQRNVLAEQKRWDEGVVGGTVWTRGQRSVEELAFHRGAGEFDDEVETS